MWETTVSYDLKSDAILSISNTKLPSTLLSSYSYGFDEVWQVVDEVVSGTAVGTAEDRHHYA